MQEMLRILVSQKPVVIIDTETGTLLKVGDSIERKDYLEEYFNVSRSALGEAINYLKFDTEKLNIDECCTIINYMMNTLGKEGMNNLLDLKEINLICKVFELQEIGF